MGNGIASENLSQCPCPLAPAPAIHHHIGLFLSLWHQYRGVFLQTVYYLVIMLVGVGEIFLVNHKESDRLVWFREALGNLGQLNKSLIEITVLRLIVFLGDVFCDPNEVDLALFLTFVFAYLHFASVFKLIGIGNDFGWLDGLVSVILTAFEHFVRPWSFMQLLGIVLTTIVVCYKNTMWSGQGKKLQREGTQEESTGLIEMTTLTRQHQDEVA
ncbi:unnamed protein product [Arabis nemorensis]|uniref:Uncharacterized protein n=1 Tax=Arabis nemorensis TaxID=586526 RepID=A0A565BMG0_9BRAS|nr:unnamed protein product [Arabis nemorensis]